MKSIVILGATGSIGTQTLDVVRRLPDRLRVVGLSAFGNEDLLREQAAEFGVSHTALEWGEDADLIAAGDDCPARISWWSQSPGRWEREATIAALLAGKDVALATKEVLVAAGELVTAAARAGGARILPIDSEHSAIFQCLQGQKPEHVEKLWLTASGGPFRSGRTNKWQGRRWPKR